MALTVEGVCPLLQVFDMRTALAFYCDVLGFTVAMSSEPRDDPDWVLLRLNGAEVMLNTMYERQDRPPAPDPARREIHRDTALFFGCRDVDGAYRHLRDAGVRVDPPVVTSYGMKQVYVTDPDGYNLCFQWRA